MKLYEKHGMKKYCPGLTSELKAMSLLMMALVFMTFGSTAQAQFHGTNIQKVCPTQVRNCLNDADCSNDDNNLCTPEVCDTTLPRTTTCIIRATSQDDFGDTVTVTGAFDEITTATGVVRIPLVGNLAVSSTFGDVTCTAGELPCTLNELDAYVQFEATYTLLPADNALNSLPDQATVANNDNCDDPNTTGCSSGSNDSQQTAASDVIDACSTGAEPDCDDSNACTADSCDPTTGLCVNIPDVDCDDSSLCTDDSCDPATGVCVNTPNFDCDDTNACTDDSCDPLTGECVNDDNFDCDDFNVCTDDSCDPTTGECLNVDNGQSCEPIPTLSVGGLVAMILTILGLGGILIRRGLLRKPTRV